MLKKQNIYMSPSPRFTARINFMGEFIGLESGQAEIYENGDTLFYSQSNILPAEKGFKRLGSRKVYSPEHRSCVGIPGEWYKEHYKGINQVRVYYTKIGLFVKPYKD